MRDLYSQISSVLAVAPAVLTASVSGATVDLRAARSVCFVVATGAIVGAAVFSVKLVESDNGVAWTDVPLALVDSNAPAALVAASSYRLGYRGSKRYVRVVVNYISGTSLALSAVAVLDPLNKPVA